MLLNPTKTLVLLRTLARVFRDLTVLKITANVQFLFQFWPNKVEGMVALPVVCLDVFPTTKRIPSFPFIIFIIIIL